MSPVQQTAHVDGRNCMGPTAPADDSPTILPIRVSMKLIAARYSHGTVVAASASWYAASSSSIGRGSMIVHAGSVAGGSVGGDAAA